MTAPEHIKEYCFKVAEESIFYELDEMYSDDYSFVYQISCTCGFDAFNVYIDDHPTAEAECIKCKKRFTLYDLALYPNAIKLSKEFEMKKYVTSSGSDVFKLCVLYEYSDEFEFSDVNFNENDITGFSLFAYDPAEDEKITIFSDETA